MRRSRFGTAAVLVTSALALTACEKPTPSVTAFSGTKSTHTDALCWQFDESSAVGAKDCLQALKGQVAEGATVKKLELSPGVLGISVDPEIAEGGWTASINGQPIMDKSTKTYANVTLPVVPVKDGGYNLQIVASAASGGARGVWWIKLNPEG